MSHRYCSNSQLSRNGGVTSSISDSEKSVVMCSLVSGAPNAKGCRVWTISPDGETRRDSFSTPLRPPRNTARAPELMSPASRRSNFLSTTLRNTETPRERKSALGRLGYLNLASIFLKGEPPPGINRGARRGSRQLRNHLDLHEEARVHQALHLHPGGRGQALLVVVVEAYIRGLQQSVHIRRKNSLLDDFIEIGAVCGERV